MSLRARIFIIISIVALLILSISIFLVVKNKNRGNQTDQNSTPSADNSGQPNLSDPASGVGTQIPAGVPVKARTPLEVEQNGVEQLAKIFIERYGTYSTDNQFENIKEAEPLATKSLWSKISLGINAPSQGSGFVGLTTKAVSASIVSWAEGKATVDLKLMRVENKGGVETTRYQDVTVEMVKENNAWLANSLVWK